MKFSSMVPSQDLEYEPGLGAVNLEVAVPAVSDSKSEKRKTYQKWSSQERFTIGKYAAINDPTAAKKIWIKKPTRVLCHVQSRARESQKRKTSYCAKSKCFTRDHMVQKFLLTLRSRGVLITSVIAVSVAKAFIARNPHLMLDHIDRDSSSWAKKPFSQNGLQKTHENNWQDRNPRWSNERGPTFVFTRYCISG